MKRYNTYDSDYTLIFSSISNREGNVRFINHSRGVESRIGLVVNDSKFVCRVQPEFPSIIADLIDLAVAIHATDRLTIQDLRKEQTRLCVVLPVRHPELLSASVFQNKLSSLLEWATGSRWLFNFRQRLDSGRIIEQPLLLSTAPYVGEVTLWSGGLDALAGLYTRLKTSHEVSFMLFGTGSNDNVYARQGQVFKALKHSFPNRLHLCRFPIRWWGLTTLR